MAVQVSDVKTTMKDITSHMGVISALMGRKDYELKELQEINKRLGAAATLIVRTVALARKMGESTATNLIDRIDNRVDELDEKTDMKWLGDNVVDKKYKGMVIINAVFDDKEDKMIKFWVRDPKTNKPKEIRPIPKDELVKVLK
jgi:hypothetical protein